MDTTENTYTPKLREILVWPDERLHMECRDIVDFDEDLERLVADMFVTMTANEGVGLAAPQIGELSNIIVIRIEPDKPLVLINPEIVEASEELFQFEEGCLSVPGHYEKRKRPESIIVRFKDIKGDEHEFEFLNLYAFAIQHEMDHLKGKVFVDGASWFKQGKIEKKMKKALKLRAEALERAQAVLLTQTQ